MQRLSIIAINGKGTLFAHHRDELRNLCADAAANGDLHPAATMIRLPRRISRTIVRHALPRHDLRGHVWQIGPCALNRNFNG